MYKKKSTYKILFIFLITVFFAIYGNHEASAKKSMFVNGRVYDAITNKPLKNAVVHVLELEKKVKTDKFGRYKVYIPRYSQYTFIVNASLYGAAYHKFSINKTIEYNFRLDRYKEIVNLNRYPNISKPNMINVIEQEYPELAKEFQVEACLVINLVVAASGRVKQVKVLSMTLSKDLEEELDQKIRKEFLNHTMVKYFEARFNRTFLNDKYVPVEFNTFINYKLNEEG